MKPNIPKIDLKLKSKLLSLNSELKNQSKFNLLISDLISQMDIDENLNNQETDQKENEEKGLDNKPNENQNKTVETQDKKQEMSIDAGAPDVENYANESDKADDTLELDSSSDSQENKRKAANSFGDLKYKAFTTEFDEIIRAEDLENEEELNGGEIFKIHISEFKSWVTMTYIYVALLVGLLLLVLYDWFQ